MPIKVVLLLGFLFAMTALTSARLNAETGLQLWLDRQKAHDTRLKQHDLSQRPVFKQRVVQVNTTTLNRNTPSQSTPTPPPQFGTRTTLNLNTATAEEIVAKLDGIGLKKAQAIVAYRQQHGAFQHVDDLKKVKGIGDKALERNRAYLRVH